MVKRARGWRSLGAYVPWEILLQINNIQARAFSLARPKIVKGPFHPSLPFHVYTGLYLGDMYVPLKVGLGKPGFETPIGAGASGGRQADPAAVDRPGHGRLYKATDPDYRWARDGSRWTAFKVRQGQNQVRQHGTRPEQIGTAGSRGCIMYNGDAVLMFNLLTPVSPRRVLD
jgi:hypothetical protein